jgi:FkbM family methyltransferase
MNYKLYLKCLVIRTPLEQPANWIRHLSGRRQARRQPESRELLLESERIEQVLKRLIGKSWNCIDVGCHLGAMLSLLTRLAPDGKHLAFEPVPEKAALLRRKFPEVEVYQVALGETAGQVRFFENLTRSGFSGLSATPDATDVNVEFMVDCKPLDHFWKPERPISFIKLDVEGSEYLVLRGAVDLLRHDHPVLLFESIPGGVEKLGGSRRGFFDFLTAELGYSIFTANDFLADANPLDWDHFDQAHHYPFLALNYFAIPSLPR